MPPLGSRAPAMALLDEAGRGVRMPVSGQPSVIVFYRGDWCPWCNGQLAVLGRSELVAALDANVVAVSVDTPERNRAMRGKLRLPFTLLSDPDGKAIRSYGCWNEEDLIADPAVVVAAGDGSIVYVQRGRDYADRAAEAQLSEVVEGLA